ncbi:hypothetical protein EQG49_00415 [Periweissella cryptocerci]|uniref:Uncharacterized protein n=1 Tax=Periweissella cryptocerci TaxID=2506420 RepID=A0A4P6YQX5_9LACO|nr:hypothetical protein [Periweissella cryptocerci]QBO35017.1 hypothetical protein EQG49_00415 [Periweissella cryptocerci]
MEKLQIKQLANVQASIAKLARGLACNQQDCYCAVHEKLDSANNLINQVIVDLELSTALTPYGLGMSLALDGPGCGAPIQLGDNDAQLTAKGGAC